MSTFTILAAICFDAQRFRFRQCRLPCFIYRCAAKRAKVNADYAELASTFYWHTQLDYTLPHRACHHSVIYARYYDGWLPVNSLMSPTFDFITSVPRHVLFSP